MKLLASALLLCLALPALADEAPLKNIQINGWGFVRYETKKDADYDKNIKDKADRTETRVNVSLKADLADNYGYVFIAPQFSKISGVDEAVPASGAATSKTGTSGSLYDSRLDLHEAYFAVKPTQNDNLYVLAGRQELAYGDQLILGSVPWHRVGRSFDGVRGRYVLAEGFTLDAFSMKLQENNATGVRSGEDVNFYGAYLTGSLGPYAKNSDIYLLKRDNQNIGAFQDTNTFGARFKSKVGESAFDYRAEATLQQNKLVGSSNHETGEYQINLEIGHSFSFYQSRIAFEYFDATRDYDQLFPTAHKFLGYADQFSRRNIKGYVGHLSIKPYEKITFLADYHIFQRHDNGRGAYSFSGASLGTVGSSHDIASELDLVASYDFTKSLQISYGHSFVSPGKYFKDQNADKEDKTVWTYLQLLARF